MSMLWTKYLVPYGYIVIYLHKGEDYLLLIVVVSTYSSKNEICVNRYISMSPDNPWVGMGWLRHVGGQYAWGGGGGEEANTSSCPLTVLILGSLCRKPCYHSVPM